MFKELWNRKECEHIAKGYKNKSGTITGEKKNTAKPPWRFDRTCAILRILAPQLAVTFSNP
jgi:hypothetical protein